MADLARLYGKELGSLGIKHEVHSTRLKERLLHECPDLECSGTPGQDILVAFKKDIDFSVRENCQRNYDEEGYILSKAAEIVRRDIFHTPASSTDDDSELHRSAPLSLKSLVQMILYGHGLAAQHSSIVSYVPLLKWGSAGSRWADGELGHACSGRRL